MKQIDLIGCFWLIVLLPLVLVILSLAFMPSEPFPDPRFSTPVPCEQIQL